MIFGNTKYSLDIVSLDGNNEGKKLKKYAIDETDYIGVHENEPFEIRFKNNTHQRVQVRISLDGTDILTGDLASTEPVGEMWMVNAYAELKLKAWPESNNGGARFIFTNTDDSVAANTHGVLSSKGVIAVAVFEEAHNPYTVRPIFNYNYSGSAGNWSGSGGFVKSGGVYGSSIRIGDNPNDTITSSEVRIEGGSNNTFNTSANSDFDDVDYSMSLCCDVMPAAAPASSKAPTSGGRRHRLSKKSVEKKETQAAVGAGEYVNQQLTRVAGLVDPKLAATLTLKYKWWTSLRSELRKIGQASATNGFPGDSEKRLDLGDTPRLKSTAKKRPRRGRRKYVELSRFV